MAQAQIGMVEASLERLGKRLPEVPANQILILRLIGLLAHDFGLMLDHHIRPFGLAEGEFRVLTALYSQPEGIANPSELCSRTTQSPANMSRISDALLRRDLITRDSSALDRRRMVLRITKHGEDLVRMLMPTIFAALREIFSALPVPEQQQLIAQLKNLAAHLDAAMLSIGSEQSP